MATSSELFTAGYHRLRGDSEWPSPDGPFPRPSVRKEYWLADKSVWWLPDRSWAVADRALGVVDVGNFKKIDVVFAEVSRMWGLLGPTFPAAVWDPFTWKWMVAKKVPVPEPGPVPGPGKPPPPTTDRERRRAQRDGRIAEVNALFDRGQISREVRDEQLSDILDDYPDLN